MARSPDHSIASCQLEAEVEAAEVAEAVAEVEVEDLSAQVEVEAATPPVGAAGEWGVLRQTATHWPPTNRYSYHPNPLCRREASRISGLPAPTARAGGHLLIVRQKRRYHLQANPAGQPPWAHPATQNSALSLCPRGY